MPTKTSARHRANGRTTRWTWLLLAALLAGVAGADGAQANPVEVRDLDVPDSPDAEVRDPGPCTIVRKVGSRPSVGTDPLLGMIEVDPDRCVRRAIERGIDQILNNDPPGSSLVP